MGRPGTNGVSAARCALSCLWRLVVHTAVCAGAATAAARRVLGRGGGGGGGGGIGRGRGNVGKGLPGSWDHLRDVALESKGDVVALRLAGYLDGGSVGGHRQGVAAVHPVSARPARAQVVGQSVCGNAAIILLCDSLRCTANAQFLERTEILLLVQRSMVIVHEILSHSESLLTTTIISSQLLMLADGYVI